MYGIATKLDFIPTADNEEAGLVIRANDKNHYDFLITMRDGKRVVMLRKCLQDKEDDVHYLEIPDGEVVLCINATASEYNFGVQKESGNMISVGRATTRDISNEVVGGFTGVFIGMYASGNGKANANPADFAWFDFESDDL